MTISGDQAAQETNNARRELRKVMAGDYGFLDVGYANERYENTGVVIRRHVNLKTGSLRWIVTFRGKSVAFKKFFYALERAALVAALGA